MKTNEQITYTNTLFPVDDVIDVIDVIKGENVSYPQVVRNFGDNYMHVINYILLLLKQRY